MELEHRFEVPVGIDSAWSSMLDMSQVAQCFPGATLTSADGDTYTGSVKVKLGPIQLTYLGKARIVEADESAHRAVIEASGAASRSASTASMTVTATATAVADDRTAVDMRTNLTITGRPAQFGRGVMVEVGNKILGQFADCLSGKLAAGVSPGPDAEADPDSGSSPGAGEDDAGSLQVAAAVDQQDTTADGATVAADGSTDDPADPPTSGSTDSAADAAAGVHSVSTATKAPAGDRQETGEASSPEAGPRHAAANYTRSPEPIDLLGSARASIVKRVVPLVLAVIALIVLRSIIKRRRGNDED